MHNRRASQSESGFAMLVVFLLAGCIAISLYMELPRAAFEAQRSREQVLIDRGEQYKRAIQLFFRATGLYPANLDALESFNNKRYLRRRYKDPMTGEEEWRVIHAGPGGVFLDSLVMKPPGQTSTEGSSAAAAEAPVSPWMQARPSDRTMPPPNPGAPATAPLDDIEGGVAQPSDLALPQPEAFQIVDDQQLVGVPPPGPGQPPASPLDRRGAPVGFPGPPSPQGPGQAPAVFQPFRPPVPGQPTVVGIPGQVQAPQSAGLNSPGPPPDNPALTAIRNMLTNPAAPVDRPASQLLSSGPRIGGGIAGVASKLEAEGIKVYNDRTKYNEWEFLYDPRLDPIGAGSMIGGPRGQSPRTGAPPAPGDNRPGLQRDLQPRVPFTNPEMYDSDILPQPPSNRPGRGR